MNSPSTLIQLVAAVTLGLLVPQFSAEAQHKDTAGTTSAQGVQHQTIDAWIADQVGQSHGDWDKDRYSFYMGFCTAGISDDAARAIAIRRLAFTFMNGSLAVGDKLTPFAFEMNVYKIGDAVPLTPDETSRGQFVSSVPRTPMPHSKGGHDIERSLYDILGKVPPAERASTIILMWSKDNASQDPDGHKIGLFSEDNPDLQNATRTVKYRSKLVRAEFQVKSDSKNVSVSVTALFPSKLASLEYGGRSPRYPTFARDTWLPSGDSPDAPELEAGGGKSDSIVPPSSRQTTAGPPHPAAGQRGYLWLAIAIAGIAIMAVILFMALSKRSGVQRQRPSVAVTAAPTAARLETIPGSLRLTVGTDEQTIAPLAMNGGWAIIKGADGKVQIVDLSFGANPAAASAGAPQSATMTPPPAAGLAFAKLTFVKSAVLLAEADLGAQFTELQGTAASQCDSRILKIEPGKRVLCRIQLPNVQIKIRFEIVYRTQSEKAQRG